MLLAIWPMMLLSSQKYVVPAQTCQVWTAKYIHLNFIYLLLRNSPVLTRTWKIAELLEFDILLSHCGWLPRHQLVSVDFMLSLTNSNVGVPPHSQSVLVQGESIITFIRLTFRREQMVKKMPATLTNLSQADKPSSFLFLHCCWSRRCILLRGIRQLCEAPTWRHRPSKKSRSLFHAASPWLPWTIWPSGGRCLSP